MASLSKGRKRLLTNIITVVLVILVYALVQILSGSGTVKPYQMRTVNNAMIGVIVAVSLNMVTGLMGQLVLGHAGFMLVGAYVSALITTNVGVSIYVSLPISLIAAGIVSAIIGAAVGIPALRLRGDYLAIITLGFGEIIKVVANNLKITGGTQGMSGIKGYPDNTELHMFTMVFIVAVITIYASYAYGTSRHGRAVISIREDEIAAESIGIHTTYYKLTTFVIAAFIAGVAGGLFAHQQKVIAPNEFDFNRSVEYLAMVVMGGMGSITGSVISAFVLTALPEFLRSFKEYRMLIYSILLIVIMLFKPTGLLGRKELSLSWIVDKVSEFIASITGKRKGKTKKGGE